MASIKPSSRYSSSNSSSTSGPLSSYSSSFSSSEKKKQQSSLVRATPQGAPPNLGSLLRKLVDKAADTKKKKGPPAAMMAIGKEVKKVAGKGGGVGGNLSALSRKLLFQKGEPKGALTEVKSNTRTLAMVLRSERDLLLQNKQYEADISQLRLLLEDRNREVDKLKDLCLRQREEIKALKDAVLFPEERNNTELEETVEKQKWELQQAKQVIPALQTQVSSLTAHLHSLALDLAQVKAEKHNARTRRMCVDDDEQHIVNSPRPETTFPSLDYSTAHPETSEYGSPEGGGGGIFFKDFNPCLTPPRFSKQLSMDYDTDGGESTSGGMLSESKSSGQMKATKIYQYQFQSDEDEKWSPGNLVSQNLFTSP